MRAAPWVRLWWAERREWTDEGGSPLSKRSVEDKALEDDAPCRWRWLTNWYVVWDPGSTDEEGWTYNFNFTVRQQLIPLQHWFFGVQIFVAPL
eukprot:SAG25_NODE_1928_length_2139_cov_1.837255_2_plen_93_part_00